MVFQHNSDSDRCPPVIPVQAIESCYCTRSRTEGMPECLASPVNKDVKKLQTEAPETCKLILLDYDSADEIFWGKAVMSLQPFQKVPLNGTCQSHRRQPRPLYPCNLKNTLFKKVNEKK